VAGHEYLLGQRVRLHKSIPGMNQPVLIWQIEALQRTAKFDAAFHPSRGQRHISSGTGVANGKEGFPVRIGTD
jgi:hypothetical protein